MPEKQIQEHLFQRVKELLPPGRSLVDEVASLLHVSQDSAYRRIRGETLLVLEEAKTICQRYNFSLDQLLNLRNDSVVFQNMELNNVVDFRTYLQGILHSIKKLEAAGEKSIIYLTNDVPFFYQFCYRSLIAFRYFFWMKTIFQHPDFEGQKFSQAALPPDVEALGKEILAVYSRIPSTEIWNTESVNGTLFQLRYYIQAGLMTSEQAREVVNGLRLSIEHVHLQADYGRKFLPGENPKSKKDNYRLFYNRVGLGDNTIMTLHDGGKTLYLNYDALNYMVTTDEAFCTRTLHQLQTIMQRSTLISSASEKQRNMFFNILYAKLPVQKSNTEKFAS